MRFTILPKAIILTKVHYYYCPTITFFSVCSLLFALYRDKPKVFLPKYSQMPILHAAHFRRVVNNYISYIPWSNALNSCKY